MLNESSPLQNTLTITEALAEIKTINARLQKKRQSVIDYTARDVRIKDPLEKTGGSALFIERERQAIADLERRIIKIRTTIQKANAAHSLTVSNSTMTVLEWLTWRRDVAPGQKQFIATVVSSIVKLRNAAQTKGGRVVAANVAQVNIDDPNAPPEVAIFIDEAGLLQQGEEIETVLGTLDGKLSLFNATTTITL